MRPHNRTKPAACILHEGQALLAEPHALLKVQDQLPAS